MHWRCAIPRRRGGRQRVGLIGFVPASSISIDGHSSPRFRKGACACPAPAIRATRRTPVGRTRRRRIPAAARPPARSPPRRQGATAVSRRKPIRATRPGNQPAVRPRAVTRAKPVKDRKARRPAHQRAKPPASVAAIFRANPAIRRAAGGRQLRRAAAAPQAVTNLLPAVGAAAIRLPAANRQGVRPSRRVPLPRQAQSPRTPVSHPVRPHRANPLSQPTHRQRHRPAANRTRRTRPVAGSATPA